MMILFIGSRGSGKTTIATYVDKELNERGYRCIRQFPGFTRRPFWRSLYTAISLWRFFDYELFRTLGFKGRSPRKTPSTYRLYLPLAFGRDLYQIQSKKADVLLYDSNILRALISGVAQNTTEPQVVADFCARKIVPSVGQLLIVSLETEPKEAVIRWMARDGVKLSTKEESVAIEERIRLREASNSVIKALVEIPNVSFVQIDGVLSPEYNAERVVSKVEHLFRSTDKLLE